MTPHHILIRLADNSIIYLSGVGTVVFNLVMMDGKPSQPVGFTRVLHVPSLQNNLLSCLYIARHKHIIIHIDSEQMDFSLNGKLLFCAPIRSDNCAVLSGSSEPLSESANWVSTLPNSTAEQRKTQKWVASWRRGVGNPRISRISGMCGALFAGRQNWSGTTACKVGMEIMACGSQPSGAERRAQSVQEGRRSARGFPMGTRRGVVKHDGGVRTL